MSRGTCEATAAAAGGLRGEVDPRVDDARRVPQVRLEGARRRDGVVDGTLPRPHAVAATRLENLNAGPVAVTGFTRRRGRALVPSTYKLVERVRAPTRRPPARAGRTTAPFQLSTGARTPAQHEWAFSPTRASMNRPATSAKGSDGPDAVGAR